jgi:hypothetical protein
MVLFFSAFITYFLYPAAPPWLAAQLELIPPVSRVLINTLKQFPASAPLALLYQYFSPNEVAAVPSLHGAAPALLALVALKLWGRRAIIMVSYPLLAGIAFVYLGEHYVADIIAGWLYAVVAFAVVWALGPPIGRLGERWLRDHASDWRIRRVHLPAWPLAFLSIGLIAVVWINPFFKAPLRPTEGDVIPGAGVRAGVTGSTRIEDIGPSTCGNGSAASVLVDRSLQPYASQYGAYLQGMETGACLNLAAASAISPLDGADLSRIDRARAVRAPERLRLPDEPPGLFTVVQVGTPAEGLQAWTEAYQEEQYALVIRVDNVSYQYEVRQLLAQLAQVVFKPGGLRQ